MINKLLLIITNIVLLMHEPYATPNMLGQINTKASFAPIVKQALPAVVNIYAARVIQGRKLSPFFDDPVFRHFFGDRSPSLGGARVQKSLGSGIIVSKDGIVITNYHVIKNARQIKVVLHDGREMEAKILISDKKNDIVALKLQSKEKNFPFLDFKNADELEVGDIVLAIGNPFGFGHTVTSGIVSGLARTNLSGNDFRSFIQTDAAINPGNSGGALITLDGKLVGVNTAIYSNTGGSIGLSFAIPSNLVMPILTSAAKGHKKIIRPWIGMKVQTIDDAMKEALGLEKVSGIVVQKVFNGSPADKHIKQGDIILSINDKEIKNEASLRFRIATLSVGDTAKIKLRRDKKEYDVNVTLISPPKIADNLKIELSGRNPVAGASVVGLSPSIAEHYGILYENGGVMIEKVRKGSLAALNGFIPGDVILSVNGQKIKKVNKLLKLVTSYKSEWNIEYRRNNSINTLNIRTW